MKKLLLFIFTFIFTLNEIVAQHIMSLEEAMKIAMEYNYDIIIARNNSFTDKANNTPGNAGMLPQISANANASYTSNNVHQEFYDGSETNYNPLSVSNINAGAELSWTLFDGGKMFVTKSKLNEIQELGEIEYRNKILQTMYAVTSSYYFVVKQKAQLIALNEVMNLNSQRLKIAEAGVNAGTLQRTDYLQAKTDYNITAENIIIQQFAIQNAKRNLNFIIGRNTDKDFDVSDSIPLDYFPDKVALQMQLDSSNMEIISYQKQFQIAKLYLKETKLAYSPNLSLHAGYYFSLTDNSAGNILKNNSFGPQVIGAFSIPIFSAGENKRKISIAGINLYSAECDLQNQKMKIVVEFQTALNEFENQQKLLEIEEENNLLTRENYEICIQRLKYGQTTSLEVHIAQDLYVQSVTRLVNFQYNLKMAEIKLRQLTADL